MWLVSLLLICSGILAIAETSPTQIHQISQFSPECDRNVDSLSCDYRKSQQESVYLTSLEEEGIRKVFLQNIKKLHLSESFCIDVALQNVGFVSVIKDEDYLCHKRVELFAKKCVLDRVPANLSMLYLDECEVDSVVVDSELESLSILKSKLRLMDISKPLANGAKAVVQDSNILKIQNLKVGSNSSLHFQSSVVNIVGSHGLEIKNSGQVSANDSSLIASEGKINLASGGTFAIEEQKGHVTIYITQDEKLQFVQEKEKIPCGTLREEQIGLECPCDPSTERNPYIALFIICLLLLILSWISISYMVLYRGEMLLEIIKKYSRSSIGSKANARPYADGEMESEENRKLLKTTECEAFKEGCQASNAEGIHVVVEIDTQNGNENNQSKGKQVEEGIAQKVTEQMLINEELAENLNSNTAKFSGAYTTEDQSKKAESKSKKRKKDFTVQKVTQIRNDENLDSEDEVKNLNITSQDKPNYVTAEVHKDSENSKLSDNNSDFVTRKDDHPTNNGKEESLVSKTGDQNIRDENVENVAKAVIVDRSINVQVNDTYTRKSNAEERRPETSSQNHSTGDHRKVSTIKGDTFETVSNVQRSENDPQGRENVDQHLEQNDHQYANNDPLNHEKQEAACSSVNEIEHAKGEPGKDIEEIDDSNLKAKFAEIATKANEVKSSYRKDKTTYVKEMDAYRYVVMSFGTSQYDKQYESELKKRRTEVQMRLKMLTCSTEFLNKLQKMESTCIQNFVVLISHLSKDHSIRYEEIFDYFSGLETKTRLNEDFFVSIEEKLDKHLSKLLFSPPKAKTKTKTKAPKIKDELEESFHKLYKHCEEQPKINKALEHTVNNINKEISEFEIELEKQWENDLENSIQRYEKILSWMIDSQLGK